MKLTRERKFGLWLAAAAVSAVVAFVAGGMLKPDEEPHYVFNVDAPAYGADIAAIAAVSPAGFTGFEDLVPGGSRTVLGGRIVEIDDEGIVLETPDATRTRLRLEDAPRLSRLEPGSADLLQPGTTVLVKTGETEGVAEAVLVIATP